VKMARPWMDFQKVGQVAAPLASEKEPVAWVVEKRFLKSLPGTRERSRTYASRKQKSKRTRVPGIRKGPGFALKSALDRGSPTKSGNKKGLVITYMVERKGWDVRYHEPGMTQETVVTDNSEQSNAKQLAKNGTSGGTLGRLGCQGVKKGGKPKAMDWGLNGGLKAGGNFGKVSTHKSLVVLGGFVLGVGERFVRKEQKNRETRSRDATKGGLLETES